MGAAKLSGDTINYLGIEGLRVAGKQGIGAIAACQLVLMGGPEYARYVGIKGLEPVGIFLPGDANYPGGARLGGAGHDALRVLRVGGSRLAIALPGRGALTLPAAARRRAVRPVRVWGERCRARGAESAQSQCPHR